MSYVLTIYSKEIYQDFILPAIDNADYTIVLQQKIFSLSDDVLVRMEIVDGEWRFVQGENYRIVKNGKSYIRKGLHNGEALNLELFNTLNFAVMIQEKQAVLLYTRNIFCHRKEKSTSEKTRITTSATIPWDWFRASMHPLK